MMQQGPPKLISKCQTNFIFKIYRGTMQKIEYLLSLVKKVINKIMITTYRLISIILENKQREKHIK